VHKEDISKDALKNRQSFNKDITDDSYNDFQDKSEEEIKDNLVTGNVISHVPYRHLPTYPPPPPPIAQNRKLNAEIFSFEGPGSKFHEIQIPKPVTSKPLQTHFPFISVFPASTVHKEDIS
jgi:hypothetical protein